MTEDTLFSFVKSFNSAGVIPDSTIENGINKYTTRDLIIHTDRGIHYTSTIYQNLLRKYGVKQSMSAPATPRDIRQ